MRANEFVSEAFDQPYPMTWEHGDDSHDALAKLSNGTNLSIMFNKDYGDYGDEEWLSFGVTTVKKLQVKAINNVCLLQC